MYMLSLLANNLRATNYHVHVKPRYRDGAGVSVYTLCTARIGRKVRQHIQHMTFVSDKLGSRVVNNSSSKTLLATYKRRNF